jgi:hypothetical protein
MPSFVSARLGGNVSCAKNADYYAPEGETEDVTYNPYLYDSFVNKKSLTAVRKAGIVWLKDKTIKTK